MFKSMTAHRRKRAEGDRGFTLIELLVVVVIIGILIAIAIPLYLNYRKGANDKAAQSDVRNAVSVFEVCQSDNTTYPTAVTAAGVMTGCDSQKITVSAGTVLAYDTPGATVSYRIAAKNDGGSKVYCYNSSKGGAVKDVTTTVVTTPALALSTANAC